MSLWFLVVNSSWKRKDSVIYFYRGMNLRDKLFFILDVLSAFSYHLTKFDQLDKCTFSENFVQLMTAVTTERRIWQHSNTNVVRWQMLSNGWQKKLIILLTGKFSAIDCQSSKALQLLNHCTIGFRASTIDHTKNIHLFVYMHVYFLVLYKPAKSFPVNCPNQLCYKRSTLWLFSLHNPFTI